METTDNIQPILDSYFEDYWTNKGIDINTQYKDLSINQFNASMLYIYNNYVYQFSESIKNYDFSILSYLVNWVMSKQLEYDIISLNTLLLLCIGCNNRQYIYKAVRNESGKVTVRSIELLQNYMQFYNGLATDGLNNSTVGLITNANNNVDMGLQYNKQQMIDSYTTRHTISLSDLPKLEEL